MNKERINECWTQENSKKEKREKEQGKRLGEKKKREAAREQIESLREGKEKIELCPGQKIRKMQAKLLSFSKENSLEKVEFKTAEKKKQKPLHYFSQKCSRQFRY